MVLNICSVCCAYVFCNLRVKCIVYELLRWLTKKQSVKLKLQTVSRDSTRVEIEFKILVRNMFHEICYICFMYWYSIWTKFFLLHWSTPTLFAKRQNLIPGIPVRKKFFSMKWAVIEREFFQFSILLITVLSSKILFELQCLKKR